MQYHLRDYSSTAKKDHLCNYCCRYIQVGERYNASVYAFKDSRIMVVKSHADGCDFFDPFEEWQKDVLLFQENNLEGKVIELKDFGLVA
ncbi:MAG: hypothetical protein WC812_00520 [Candidatus Pacearchaeota archaeon]|jgi:hypothetical protein